MNDTDFIELAIRHLDGATNAAEVENLGAAMLDNAARRATYRDLAQQSQLAHEWQLSAGVPRKSRRTIIRLAVAASAAAAAILLATMFLHSEQSAPTTRAQVASAYEVPDYFRGKGPSWQEIYPSLFDRPNFTWRSEFSQDNAPSDTFSEGGLPPAPAATPSQEFSEHIAPIAMLPDSSEDEPHLYSILSPSPIL